MLSSWTVFVFKSVLNMSLRSVAVFERRASGSTAGYEEEAPLAIQQVALCAESRRLAVALPHGHVVLFKFRKSETHGETCVSITPPPVFVWDIFEIPEVWDTVRLPVLRAIRVTLASTEPLQVLEIPMISEALEEETSPEADGAGSRSMSFCRGADGGEAEGRKVGAAPLVPAVEIIRTSPARSTYRRKGPPRMTLTCHSRACGAARRCAYAAWRARAACGARPASSPRSWRCSRGPRTPSPRSPSTPPTACQCLLRLALDS